MRVDRSVVRDLIRPEPSGVTPSDTGRLVSIPRGRDRIPEGTRTRRA